MDRRDRWSFKRKGTLSSESWAEYSSKELDSPIFTFTNGSSYHCLDTNVKMEVLSNRIVGEHYACLGRATAKYRTVVTKAKILQPQYSGT